MASSSTLNQGFIDKIDSIDKQEQNLIKSIEWIQKRFIFPSKSAIADPVITFLKKNI